MRKLIPADFLQACAKGFFLHLTLAEYLGALTEAVPAATSNSAEMAPIQFP
jgi:hypothetical protein